MTLAITQGEPAYTYSPSSVSASDIPVNLTSPTLGERVSAIVDRATRFFFAPKPLACEGPVPEFDVELIKRVQSAREAFDHARLHPGSKTAQVLTEAVNHYDKQIKDGFESIKSRDKPLYWRLTQDYQRQPKTPQELGYRLSIEFRAMSANPTAQRFFNHFLTAAERHRWEQIEPTGLKGFAHIFTGNAPTQKL